MFGKTSRYYGLASKTLAIEDPAGGKRSLRYVARRFLPGSEDRETLVEHTVVDGDRLDNVTARYLGDPTQFWRLCDANRALHPEELTEEAGGTIEIALPTP